MIDKVQSRSSDQRNEKVRLRECLKTKTTLYKMSVRERESKKERKRERENVVNDSKWWLKRTEARTN